MMFRLILILVMSCQIGIIFEANNPFNLRQNQVEIENSENQKHVFYLHGSILEGEKRNAVSQDFGEYQYKEIIARLELEGFVVHSELREANTNVDNYSDRIIEEIKKLILQGVEPQNIFLIGASKGALIAMLVSRNYSNPQISYVIMGNCNQWVADHYDIKLHGNVLSIYESTDDIGGESCDVIKRLSPDMLTYKEYSLNTGLNHGFLYKPLEAWLKPTLEFIKR